MLFCMAEKIAQVSKQAIIGNSTGHIKQHFVRLEHEQYDEDANVSN